MKQIKESSGSESYSPSPGNIFLLIELVSENVVADATVQIAPGNFRLEDENGNAYTSNLVIATPEIDPILRRGEKSQGWITFEVPKDAEGLILQYIKFGALSGASPIFQIDLER